MIQRHLAGRRSALDAGCGSGAFARFFCDQGLAVTALDYSQEAVARTRELTAGQARVVVGDLLAKDLPAALGQSFDLIFSDGLFEHFSVPQQDIILRNLRAVLADDGVLITVVPNRWSPWQLIRPLLMPGIHEDPFIMADLVKLHSRNGFEVIEKGGLNTVPWRLSPDRTFGQLFGMLLYTVSRRPGEAPHVTR